jgi:hypothetical protein
MEVQYAAVFGPKGKPSAYSALRVDGSLYTFSSARTVGLQDDIDVIGVSEWGSGVCISQRDKNTGLPYSAPHYLGPAFPFRLTMPQAELVLHCLER